MRFILIILITFPTLLEAGMPGWWFASRKYVENAKKELAEFDKKLAEMDQDLVRTDHEIQRVLALNEEFRIELARLKLMNENNADQAHINLSEANGRIKEINTNLNAMDRASAFLQNVFRVLGGDWTGILALISPLLASLGYGEVKRRQANQCRNDAEKYRTKAVSLAYMNPEESKAVLKSDRDFPEIN